MANCHSCESSFTSVPLAVIPPNSTISLKALNKLWNQGLLQPDCLSSPKHQVLQSTLKYGWTGAPDCPNLKVIKPRARHRKYMSVITNQKSCEIDSIFSPEKSNVSESPLKAFQRMKELVAQDKMQKTKTNISTVANNKLDMLLTPFSKTCDYNANKVKCYNKNYAQELTVCDGFCVREKPSLDESSTPPIDRIFSQTLHTSGQHNVVSGCGSRIVESSNFASTDTGNESDDEMSENNGALNKETLTPEICKASSSRNLQNGTFGKDSYVENRPSAYIGVKAERLLKDMNLCDVLRSSLKVHIPKKQKAKSTEVHTKKPTRNRKEVTLHEWVVKPVGTSDVCVEGKRTDMEDVDWHSSAIVERVNSYKVKTLSGQIYKLKGDPDLDAMKLAGFNADFIQKFKLGFPVNWKTVMDQFFMRTNCQVKSKHKVQLAKIYQPVLGRPSTFDSNSPKAMDIQENISRKNKPCKSLLKKLELITKISQTDQQSPGDADVMENQTNVFSQRDKSKRNSHHQNSYTDEQKHEESTPMSQSSFCKLKVSRSGRVLKPVLKDLCWEQLAMNKDFNTTFEEGCPKELDTFSNLKSRTSSRKTELHCGSISPGKAESDGERDQLQREPTIRKLRSAGSAESSLGYTTDYSSRRGLDREKACSENLHLNKTYFLRGRFSDFSESASEIEYLQGKSVTWNLTSLGTGRVENKADGATDRSACSKLPRNQAGLAYLERKVHKAPIVTCTEKNSITMHTFSPEKTDIEKCTKKSPVVLLTPLISKDKLKARCVSHNLQYKTPVKIHPDYCSIESRPDTFETETKLIPKTLNLRKTPQSFASDFDLVSFDSKTVSKPFGYQNTTCGPDTIMSNHKDSAENNESNFNSHSVLTKKYGQEYAGHKQDDHSSAVATFPEKKRRFCQGVVKVAVTSSSEECHTKFKKQQVVKASKAKSEKLNKSEKNNQNVGLEGKAIKITAKVGTLKRKKQMREFLEQIPKDDHDDIFSSTPFRNKRVKLPSMNVSSDDSFELANANLTPSSKIFPLDATPQCDHLTPGMLKPVDRSDADKYMYRLQKSTKRNWFMTYDKIKKKPAGPLQTPVSRRTSSLTNGPKDTSIIGKLLTVEEPVSSDEDQDYYFCSSP
ncbi:uncharacterized protein LOC134582597 [Pelobates fuscus]|uniref:uncharacterized protein LOC134582597 n=1 Tax=Pelobates fuscus TaxID=191477 RepID=UPI002FE4991C